MQRRKYIVPFPYRNTAALAALWLCAAAAGLLFTNASISAQGDSGASDGLPTPVTLHLLLSLAGCLLLFGALRTLHLGARTFARVAAVTAFGLAAGACDLRGAAASASILLVFAAIETRRDVLGGLPLLFGAAASTFSLAALAFAIFSKRRIHLLAGLAISGGGEFFFSEKPVTRHKTCSTCCRLR